MTLLPNQPFTQGDPWTPELADLAFNTPVYDDQPQYLGHRTRLLDTELSSAPGSLLSRFNEIQDNLRVTIVSGLTVNFAGGIGSLPNGDLFSLSPSNQTVPNNTTSFIWISLNSSGVPTLTIGALPPVIRILLARVVSAAGSISVLEDLRHPRIQGISPVASVIRTFGGSSVTDKVCVNNETLADGLYYFRNFTIPAGALVNLGRFCKIVCSGNVNIAGTAVLEHATQGGKGVGYAGTVTSGGLGGAGIGGGSGDQGGFTYSSGQQPYGSGGSASFTICLAGGIIFGGNGGRGGGGLWIEAAGTINVTGSIFANAFVAQLPSIQAGQAGASGAGGGSGGLIYLASSQSVLCTSTSVLQCQGTPGSNAVANFTTTFFQGGHGGGGGIIQCVAPSINVTGATLSVTGGAGGSSVNTPASGVAGGGGGSFGGLGGTTGTPGATGGAGTSGLTIFQQLVPIG